MHYLLFYDVVEDYVTRRAPLRAAHLSYAQTYVDRGELILGGALADPVDASVLLFQADSKLGWKHSPSRIRMSPMVW